MITLMIGNLRPHFLQEPDQSTMPLKILSAKTQTSNLLLCNVKMDITAKRK